MDCDDCLDKLYAFLDKELAPREQTQITQHLSDCGDCEDNFDFEERFLKVLRDCGTADLAPRELRERVVERLRRESPPPAL